MAPKLPRLSVRLHGGMTPALCVEQAKAAEAAGIDAIWFAENPFNRGIVPAAAACALATKTQSIGAGVFNPYGRHPTLIAMEIGALDELSGGRVRLGIGSGLGHAVERMGFDTKRALTTLREAIASCRALRGERVKLCRKRVQHRRQARLPPRADIRRLEARGEKAVKAAARRRGMMSQKKCTEGFVAKAVRPERSAPRRRQTTMTGVVSTGRACRATTATRLRLSQGAWPTMRGVLGARPRLPGARCAADGSGCRMRHIARRSRN